MPTSEELETLREHATKIEQFSRADRFMMEMGRIPRYQQRLKSLFFKKNFEDRIGEVRAMCMCFGGGWGGGGWSCADTVSMTLTYPGSSQC